MKNYVNNPIVQLLHNTFSKSAQVDIENHYLKNMETIAKWTCYSDYCLNNKQKPNDVITFTLVPYIHDFNSLSELIKIIAKKDIKSSKTVNIDFIHFLTNYPLLNISFVLKNRRKLSSQHEDYKTTLLNSFQALIDLNLARKKNFPEHSKHYEKLTKKYKCVLEQIKIDKKVNLIADMSLITMLGAYVSAVIVEKCKPTLFGWFSDRDAINDICDGVSSSLFYSNLWELTEFDGKFAYTLAKSTSDPFFDEFIRIPDYIAGTLADLDFDEMAFSKDKFKNIFINYMAENNHNNFIFEIDFNKDGNLSCQRFKINKSNI
nr:hypothetical protein [uncultured Fluviicola sp.]